MKERGRTRDVDDNSNKQWQGIQAVDVNFVSTESTSESLAQLDRSEEGSDLDAQAECVSSPADIKPKD